MRSWPSPSSPGTTAIAFALHRHDRDALVLDAGPHDDVGVGEHVAVVAAGLDRGREVRAELLELQRRAGRERGFGIDDRGQRVVLDDDRLGRVDRRVRVSATTAAIASPTKRTLSSASGGRAHFSLSCINPS